MKFSPYLPAAVVALAALSTLPRADAALVARAENYPAVNVCQGALPSYEGLLRKRPKALQNEGGATSFVTCGLHGQGLASSIGPRAKRVSIYFINVGNAPVSTTCTAVEALGEERYVTKTTVTSPGNTQNAIGFTALELDPANGWWRTPAISCSLPPGAGISTIWYHFEQDTGV